MRYFQHLHLNILWSDNVYFMVLSLVVTRYHAVAAMLLFRIMELPNFITVLVSRQVNGQTLLVQPRFTCSKIDIFIPRHTIVAGYYGFMLVVSECVHPSVHPSVFRFRMITWVNINGFSPNLVRALILWRSGLGLLMGKFRQFLMELSAPDTPIFTFPDDI